MTVLVPLTAVVRKGSAQVMGGRPRANAPTPMYSSRVIRNSKWLPALMMLVGQRQRHLLCYS